MSITTTTATDKSAFDELGIGPPDKHRRAAGRDARHFSVEIATRANVFVAPAALEEIIYEFLVETDGDIDRLDRLVLGFCLKVAMHGRRIEQPIGGGPARN